MKKSDLEKRVIDAARKIAEAYEDRGSFSTDLEDDDYADLPSEEALLMEELVESLEELDSVE